MVMKKYPGFTLIELMIAVALIGIVMGIAVPSMQIYIKNSKIKLATNELVSAFYVARSAAIKNSAFGCVCPSANMNVTLPVCKTDNDNWETGWMAFADATGDCIFQNTDTLLKVWDGSVAAGNNFRIRNNDTSINDVHYVRFNSRGEPVRINGTSQQGNFEICDDRNNTADGAGNSVARIVELSASGRARSSNLYSKIGTCP